MSKFKVGDKVKVRSDLNENDRYYNENKETWDDCVSEMVNLRGKTVTIKEVGETGKYRICEESYSWTDEMFIEPRREFIVIRRSGAETIAELRHDREVIKSAVATCSEKDTFDFETGAKLAFDRLMGREMITFSYEIAPDKEPQPAHRFKVGDRVDTGHQRVGTVIFVDVEPDAENKSSYLVRGEKNWDGEAWIGCVTDEKITSGKGCDWFKYYQLSHAPAPEPPKFYTGKVFAVSNNGTGHDERIPRRNSHVFEIKDGFILGELRQYGFDSYSKPIKSFEDFKNTWFSTTWHEVKSDV